MSEAEMIRRLADALLADWRKQHPGMRGMQEAAAGVGAVRAAHVALRVMREMQETTA